MSSEPTAQITKHMMIDFTIRRRILLTTVQFMK